MAQRKKCDSIEDVLERYLEYKRAVCGLSEATLDTYKIELGYFFDMLEIYDEIKLLDTKKEDVINWLVKLEEKGIQPSTRGKRIMVVKIFFSYLLNQEGKEIDADILKIKQPKVPKKEQIYIKEEDVMALQYYVRRPMLKAIIAILNCTGIRYCELMRITCEDIKTGYTYILGKGNKKRPIAFSPECQRICLNYINGERARIVKRYNLDTNILLITTKGKIATEASINALIKSWAKRAGIPYADKLSMHKFRHGWITAMLNHGTPIHIVSKAVGHTNISTTTRYIHAEDEQVMALMRGDLGKDIEQKW